MNVLLSAYACAPGKGSEPQIGWNWTRAIQTSHPVWVLTRTKHKPAIERSLREHPLPNAHFVYIDLPKWARPWKQLPGGVYVYYLLWQWLAYRRALQLCSEISFDAIHHVTFCMFWMPAFLSRLPAPFIWGPLGGGESTPAGLRPELPFSSRLFESLRDLSQQAAVWNPWVRLTARRSTLALAGTPETAVWLRRIGCRNVRLTPVVGITESDLEAFEQSPPRASTTFRAFSAGRLLHWKGHDLALRAIAGLSGKLDGFEYHIFGSGPERRRLEALITSLGIAGLVHFRDNVPRAELLREMPAFDVLLHPSAHDSGGFICMEAMASGCPVICIDSGGPAVQVAPQTGMKIEPLSTESAIQGIARALLMLYESPSLRRRMAEAGRTHVEQQLSMHSHMESLSDIYAGERSVVETR